MTTFSDEEMAWIGEGLDSSPDSYFEAFDISDKRRGYMRYLRLIQTADLSDAVKKTLLNAFEIWKRDMAPQFWLRRRARIAAIDIATVLVEGSVPYAEGAILQNAKGRKPEHLFTSYDKVLGHFFFIEMLYTIIIYACVWFFHADGHPTAHTPIQRSYHLSQP